MCMITCTQEECHMGEYEPNLMTSKNTQIRKAIHHHICAHRTCMRRTMKCTFVKEMEQTQKGIPH